MSLAAIMLAVCILGLLAIKWAERCNDKTHRDQIYLLGKISAKFPSGEYVLPHDDINWFLKNLFDRVSYGKHFWYLFTFRDPWALYGRDNLEKLDLAYDAATMARMVSGLMRE